MSPASAVIRGHFVVNVPVLIIIVATYFLGRSLLPDVGAGVLVAIGAAAGWPWWSFATPRWRAWAMKAGADPVQTERLASLTLLSWPKGSLLEKTEFPPPQESTLEPGPDDA